ncbi:MAG: helix-turn-helix transcriptional regulator [Spirosomataceae bacterium]
MDSITERIRKIREEKGISKAKMSDALEIDPSNYNRYEKQGKDWTVSQIQKIAVALGITVIELLTGEGQKVEESEKVKALEKRVEELEQSLKEVRELNVYYQKTIDSKNVSLKIIYETIDMSYAFIQQTVLEDAEMPQNLAVIAYSQLNDLVKIAKLIVDAKDLGAMEESIRKFIEDDSNDWSKFLSIFDKRERKGGLSYWDGKNMVSAKRQSNSE